MTDRELLEAAAKAAGDKYSDLLFAGETGLHLIGGRPKPNWNPLTNDGDALRLAVKLKMDILYGLTDVEVIATFSHRMVDGEEVNPWAWEVTATDPYAATRRAIVRAAAEIGRGMT